MDIPSFDEIRAMHLKHSPHAEAFELVFTHCEIVWKVAEQFISVSDWGVDPDLVRAGCLLHDIGVYRLYGSEGRIDVRNYVRHGLLGHEILESEGLPEELCRFCSCHTGVGLSKEDVLTQGLPLPPADYIAVTPEERLVMYADKFHSKTTPPKFVSPDTYATYVRRFGQNKVEAFAELRAQFGDPELEGLAASYGHHLT
ncbi:HDIG domain-containing metalloprotein [Streptomyces sp. NPDC014891]|uniref:HDIG domain-containing metalloprotein n=1 Tax=Streptomyces sp. NPDC014891 TaxID=3364929 RepID=UPI0036F94656